MWGLYQLSRCALRGARGLRIERLDHATLPVRDLQCTQEWLRGVLGMVPFRADDPHFASEDLRMVRNGPAVVALLRLPEGEAPLQGSRSQKGHVSVHMRTSVAGAAPSPERGTGGPIQRSIQEPSMCCPTTSPPARGVGTPACIWSTRARPQARAMTAKSSVG